MPYFDNKKSGGYFKSASDTKVDLSSAEGLAKYAQSQGLDVDIKEKKLSFLQRLGRGLSALEPANALYQSHYEGKNLVTTYIKDIFQEAGSAVTGRELRSEPKKTFKDILLKEGMKDREGKIDFVDVAGLAGDLLTDPSTYFGGAIVKGGKKVLGTVAKTATEIGEKVAPKTTAVLSAAFDAGKDALGNAFVYGYKTTPGLADNVVEYINKLSDTKSAVGKKYVKLFSALDSEAKSDLVDGMIKLRKSFGTTREKLIKSGMSFEEATKTLVRNFDKIQPADMFTNKDTIKFYSEVLSPELQALKKKTATKMFGEAKVGEKITLDPILEEAKKYKSAEEFVKAQPTYYRGEGGSNIAQGKALLAEGKHFAADAEYPKGFGKVGEYVIKPNAKVLDLGDSTFAEISQKLGIPERRYITPKELSAVAKEKGYSVLKYNGEYKSTGKQFTHIVDLTGDSTITKSQLTDIWNKAQKTITASKEIAEETAGNVGEDMLMSHYFPFIKKQTVKEFSNAMRVSNEGYLKRFKGVLDKEDIISDPVEAYAKRAAQLETDGITKEMLNKFVSEYGKPLSEFKNADEALASGYKLVRDKGLFGKDVGYLPKQDYKFINEIYDPSFKIIDELAKATGFDTLTTLFKQAVTGLFAPFHVRNWVSGNIQNYEVLGKAALSPDNIALGQQMAYRALKESDDLSGILKLGNEEFKVKDLIEPFKNRFNISSQYISDFGIENQEKLLKTSSKLNPIEAVRVVGNYIETQQKMTAYLTAIKKGRSINEALKLAEDAGFDYSKLAPFEKHVMRRLIPFYSFTRKNLELQLKTLARNPERLGLLLKTGRAAGTPQGTEEGEINMPDWMRNNFIATLGRNVYNMPVVISGFGTPIEAGAQVAEKGLMGVLATLNPLIKIPLERATGKDFFRETDLKDVYNAEEYSIAPQFIKDFLKIKEVEKTVYKNNKPTDEKRITYVGDPERLHIARNLFTSRGVNYLHTLFGDKELTEKGRIIKAVTGFKPYEIDEESVKYFEERNNYRDLTDLLKRLGLVRTFEKTILPKQ